MRTAADEQPRDTADVIAPPPLIALATVALGLLADWLFPLFVLRVTLALSTRIVLGVLLVAAGAAIAIVAERTFRRIGTNVAPWEATLKLASTGIYARLRNPMYVGVSLMIVGIGVALGSDWTLLLFIPAALLLHHGVVKREERYLEEKFGEPYRRYKASVPRYGWPP